MFLLVKHPSSSRTDVTVISGGPDKGEDAALNRAETERGGAKRASRVLPNREKEYCMMVLQTAEYSPSVAVSRLWHE